MYILSATRVSVFRVNLFPEQVNCTDVVGVSGLTLSSGKVHWCLWAKLVTAQQSYRATVTLYAPATVTTPKPLNSDSRHTYS
jgi:hypothetical protein